MCENMFSPKTFMKLILVFGLMKILIDILKYNVLMTRSVNRQTIKLSSFNININPVLSFEDKGLLRTSNKTSPEEANNQNPKQEKLERSKNLPETLEEVRNQQNYRSIHENPLDNKSGFIKNKPECRRMMFHLSPSQPPVVVSIQQKDGRLGNKLCAFASAYALWKKHGLHYYISLLQYKYFHRVFNFPGLHEYNNFAPYYLWRPGKCLASFH